MTTMTMTVAMGLDASIDEARRPVNHPLSQDCHTRARPARAAKMLQPPVMARVLVVEDERDLQEVIAYNLRELGYDVVMTGQGGAVAALVGDQRPDLIILDLMLPDVSGLEVCRNLKSDPATRGIPVVMVTAKGSEVDRVVGFELGADDYVVKPFSVRELLLRIQAVLRRAAPPEAVAAPRAITFGRLRIDREAPSVLVDDREVALTALELRLLCTLYERRNRVQSRSVLLDDVWSVSGENATRTVDTHVKRLREKLGPVGAYIETIRGIGYRFVGAPPKQPS
jgi:two-component system phosphate regulon response regulator PhoB